MAVSIVPFDGATMYHDDLAATTNACVEVLNTQAVTVNASANGGSTTGNGAVIGHFGASVLYGPELRGGLPGATANLNITTNAVVNSSVSIFHGTTVSNSGGVWVGSNTVVRTDGLMTGNNAALVGGFRYVTVSTTQQVIDYFAIGSYRAAEYSVSVTDQNSNSYHFTKFLVTQDGLNSFMTEYGTVSSNGSLGTFSAGINSTAVAINFTPTSNSTVAKGYRMLVPV